MSGFGGGGFGGATTEKRQFGRRQTQLHGWVTIPGRPRLPCMVKDLSVGGALLAFDGALPNLPFCFKLAIVATKFETACEIRHTKSNAVGVEFVPMERLVGPEKRAAADCVEDWTGFGSNHLDRGTGRGAEGSRRS